MYNYAIRFEQDSAPGQAVFCRDLPELNSYGDDKEHAIREAVDAIETTLSIYVDQRRAIPEASAPEPGEQVIYLPAVTVAKIVLWNEMMARDMRKADLCRLLGLAQTQGDRLVDFLHTSKMEAIEKALAALGKRLVITHEAYTRYEILYTKNGERNSFVLLYNDGVDPWTALLAGLKLNAPKDLDSPSAEQVCRAHGISQAFAVAM